MSDSLYNFETKGRLPVVPLSYEFVDLAKIRELIVNYSNGDVYVKTDSGDIVNIAASENIMKKFAEYLKNNPDIIANITVVTDNGSATIKDTFSEFYRILEKLDNKSFLYAGSATDGGPATEAERLLHSLRIIEDDITTEYNGSEDVEVHMDKYYRRTGGEITGSVTLKDRLVLGSEYSYGTELPENGSEGQLFFLIEE